jgi:hypothetical protein
MLIYHRYNNLLILFLIIILGLGLAIVQPFNNNSLGFAAESEASRQDNTTVSLTRYYVARSGDGTDGSSWKKAFPHVQAALVVAAARGGGEIWVAKGVYYPDESVYNPDSRFATFSLQNNIKLYGGFSTGDTKLSDRDWENNVTVLSGDIDGNDFTDDDGVVLDTGNIHGKNAYHVITARNVNSSAGLDGFVITAGSADVSSGHQDAGGGIYCYSNGIGEECSPTLKNLVFSGNYAGWGGAMYIAGNNGGVSNPLLTNIHFIKNKAKTGGAIVTSGYYGTVSPNLKGATFSANSAESDGGAVSNVVKHSANVFILEDVIFSGNSAGENGGALENRALSDASNLSLVNAVFTGNSAGKDGGAMFNGGYYDGGDCSPVLTNVTFSGNKAGGYGGAMYNEVDDRGDCNPQVRNSIFWNNMDYYGAGSLSAAAHNKGAKIYLVNSIVQGAGSSGGSWTQDKSYVDGGRNIDKNPRFVKPVDPSKAPTSSGNLHLQGNSPAIDAGNNKFVTDIPTDLDGNPRISGAHVDMGAYEYLPQTFLPFIRR